MLNIIIIWSAATFSISDYCLFEQEIVRYKKEDIESTRFWSWEKSAAADDNDAFEYVTLIQISDKRRSLLRHDE